MLCFYFSVISDYELLQTHGGNYAVVTHRWQKFTDFIISKDALESLSQHADEFLVHGVDVEGKR